MRTAFEKIVKEQSNNRETPSCTLVATRSGENSYQSGTPQSFATRRASRIVASLTAGCSSRMAALGLAKHTDRIVGHGPDA